MRRILASSLMLSSLIFPAVAKASTLPADDSAPTQHLRISTGVLAPSLDDSLSRFLPADMHSDLLPAGASISLTLTVDQTGRPQNVQVVKSLNPFWDARIVEAVQKAHYRPGKIDDQAIPMDMNLTVNITH